MQLCLGLRDQLNMDREASKVSGGTNVSAMFKKLVAKEALRHEYSSIANIFSMEERFSNAHAWSPQSDPYPSPHEEERVLAEWYEFAEFSDDVAGKVLDKKLAIKARIAEMHFFSQDGSLHQGQQE